MQPITRDHRFVLEGTEVFHRRCVRGIANSLVTKLEQTVNELRTQVGQLDANANYHQRRAEDALRDFGESQSSLREMKQAHKRLKTDRDEWQRDCRKAEDEKTRLANELVDARAQLSRVRADLAAAQQRGLEQAMAELAAVTPERKEEDPTVIRFSLLEVD
jgi:chromosome segregation ATPase